MKWNPERRIALFFTLCNIPLGLAGAYGLFLIGSMAVGELLQGRYNGATAFGLACWIAGLCGYALAWGYFRVARNRRPPGGNTRLWTLSAVYNGLGTLAGIAFAAFNDSAISLSFLWFPLAVFLSLKARRFIAQTGDPKS